MYTQLFFNMVNVLLWSIIFHELGHLLYFNFVLKKNVLIYFSYNRNDNLFLEVGAPRDYIDLTSKEKRGIYVMGIMYGLVPSLIALFFNPIYIIITAIYVILGCRKDLKNLKRVNEE